MDLEILDYTIINNENTVCVEGIEYTEVAIQNVTCLRKEDIDNATEFNYTFDSGSVDEMFWWQCSVRITPLCIRLEVLGNYGEKVLYDQIFDLTSEQYNQFKSELKRKNIVNTEGSISFYDGCSGFLEVTKGKQLLFKTDMSDLIYYSHSVGYVFYHILPIGEPRKVFEHPDFFIHDFPIDKGELTIEDFSSIINSDYSRTEEIDDTLV